MRHIVVEINLAAALSRDPKFAAIHRLAEEIAPTRIGLALTADDVRRLPRRRRKVGLIGVENAYSLGRPTGYRVEYRRRMAEIDKQRRGAGSEGAAERGEMSVTG